MILNELHVTQSGTGTECHGMAIAGYNGAVGVKSERTTRATCCKDHRTTKESLGFTSRNFDSNHTLSTTIFNDQISSKVLIKTLDLWVFQRSLEQGMEHMEAGFISGKPGTLNLHTTESTHVDITVVFTGPWAAPVLQTYHFFGRVGDEVINSVLIAQPITTSDSILKVVF